MNPAKLEGKFALLTGAGSGIGRATARPFAREGAGVAAVDLKGAEETAPRSRRWRPPRSSASAGGNGGAAYTTSKHGVIGFTRQLCFDYARRGIRADVVCPGAVETG